MSTDNFMVEKAWPPEKKPGYWTGRHLSEEHRAQIRAGIRAYHERRKRYRDKPPTTGYFDGCMDRELIAELERRGYTVQQITS